MIVGRNQGDELEVRLTSDEPLGSLGDALIQDVFGTSGQLSLYHSGSDTTYALLMVPDDAATPDVPDDVLVGSYPLSSLPNGSYELRGRVRDDLGNVTVLGSYEGPDEGYEVKSHQVLTISIRDSADSPIFVTARLELGARVATSVSCTAVTLLGNCVLSLRVRVNPELGRFSFRSSVQPRVLGEAYTEWAERTV